jgi:hypothetical protein
MHKVVLFVEAPVTLVSPSEWNWDKLINHEGTTDKDRAPVTFAMAHPVQEGTA